MFNINLIKTSYESECRGCAKIIKSKEPFFNVIGKTIALSLCINCAKKMHDDIFEQYHLLVVNEE